MVPSLMAAWLDRQQPDGVRVLSSPAVCTEQTVVGYWPVLGHVVAQFLGLQAGECSIRKGAYGGCAIELKKVSHKPFWCVCKTLNRSKVTIRLETIDK